MDGESALRDDGGIGRHSRLVIMSRPDGNAGRDALKVGELVAARRTTTPSQAVPSASPRTLPDPKV